MPEPFRDYFSNRGALGILILLKRESQRFTDLRNQLHISDQTLSNRLGQARELGLVTPAMNPKETSVGQLYQLTERGYFIVEQMEQIGMDHAYLTMIEMRTRVKEGEEELKEWVMQDGIERKLASLDDESPYETKYGEDIFDEDVAPDEFDNLIDDESY